MATIYDVAKAAGVSPKTVSRVLNGDAPVGAKTRDVVSKAIAELGYIPSPAARSMRSNRSGLIGLITGAISQSEREAEATGLPSLILAQGIQRVIGASPMTLMIADTGNAPGDIARLFETFKAHRVEGLIFAPDFHARVALPASVSDMPIVIVNGFDDEGTPCVVPDDRNGQRALVTAIIGTGHQRIAYITLQENIVATQKRTQGYREALDAAGIAYDPALVRVGELNGGEIDPDHLAHQINALLTMPEPPTVICCGNDRMAMQVYGILRARGLSVPQEISVAGFDDHRVISETLYPPLTTAELPYFKMGERAAERLLRFIAGQTDGPARDVVPGGVCWRMSVQKLETKSQ